jgi:hypothetical protein
MYSGVKNQGKIQSKSHYKNTSLWNLSNSTIQKGFNDDTL